MRERERERAEGRKKKKGKGKRKERKEKEKWEKKKRDNRKGGEGVLTAEFKTGRKNKTLNVPLVRSPVVPRSYDSETDQQETIKSWYLDGIAGLDSSM